ncbi:MAG: aminotransferase class I/II-fold pyridoxal phosphate-dependent enzyme, partial [Clostridia bacterium]|nr:aminotransferase class I/II-fold pyridoxal phosphate-dependent enzyme [Clostridia bacterium]
HQFAIMSAPTKSQYAAVEALKNSYQDVIYMRDEYNMRRTMLVRRLREIGFDCFEPKGAFYVFPSLKPFGMSSDEFCQRLLKEEKVAIIPGNAFGESGEGFARISYAYSIKKLSAALDRIENFVNKL